jgi:hypothetical protein
MEYRKLNLIDGDDQDLKDFMSFLQEAIENRSAGASQLVNIEMMSKLIALEVIYAFVVFNEFGNIGIQISERSTHWINSKSYKNVLRLQYIRDATADLHHKAALHWVTEVKKMYPNDDTMIASINGDELFLQLPNFGLKLFSYAYSLD